MKPFKCPICNGTKLVSGGFYISSMGGAGTSYAATESCKQCNGTGIIWGQDDACSATEFKPSVILETPKLNLEQEVTHILRRIGIPAHVKGYEYLREAIILSVDDERYIHKITQRLYPDVALKFDTTKTRVERAIRHAIEIAFSSRGNMEAIETVFSYAVNPGKGKATNSEFIATIADTLRLRRKMS